MRSILQVAALAALVATLPAAASAVDGVLEINQACAATGCFPGDAPGFPVTIDRDQTASYRLTSNLVNLDVTVSTIVIQDDHVTLDLNGFAVSGPTLCTGIGSGLSCLPVGPGHGISGFGPAAPSGIVVTNGVVRGAPGYGILLPGNGHRVEGVHVVSNGGIGIAVNPGSAIVSCRVDRNGSHGIVGAAAAVIRGNVVVGNWAAGLVSGPGVIAGNVIRENGFVAINRSGGGGVVADNAVTDNGSIPDLSASDGYARNVFRGNGVGSQVSGGVEIGANLCGSNTTCP